MKTLICTFALSSFLTSMSWASAQTLECYASAESSTAMNRFTLTGSIEITEKGSATAQLTGTTQMAGVDSLVSSSPELNYSGTARVYPAKSLGINEVTLIQIRAVLNGRVMNLTAASGLKGPQSTLTIQGVPFRAECKLK